MRDFLLQLATANLYRARWTSRIHEEWTRNVLKNRPDLKQEQLDRTVASMDVAVQDCLVTNYEDLEACLELPDPDDRHVVAAAIRAGADAIITFNLKDFPANVLERYDIEAQHPDDFLHYQFGLDQASVIIAAQRIRRRLTSPSKTAAEYLDTLEAQKLPQLVADLRPFEAVI